METHCCCEFAVEGREFEFLPQHKHKPQRDQQAAAEPQHCFRDFVTKHVRFRVADEFKLAVQDAGHVEVMLWEL